MLSFGVGIELVEGVLTDPDRRMVRRASDMRGYYADEAALERLIDQNDNPLHYEVFEKRMPEEEGHLRFCMSVLQPGQIGGECFMTKGHNYGDIQKEGFPRRVFVRQGREVIEEWPRSITEHAP